MTAPWPLALNVPGIETLPLTGHPASGEVTVRDGTPVVPVYLGRDGGTVPVSVTAADEGLLAEYAAAFDIAHARLRMWLRDHRDPAAPGAVA